METRSGFLSPVPERPLKPCNHPGCGRLTRARYCPAHERQRGKKGDKDRPTANQRGYDYRWQKARAAFLREHPLCECPNCQAGQLRVRPANVVDHHIPHRGDPVLFWDRSNWRALNKQCHDSWKQSVERAGRGGSKSLEPSAG